MTVAPEAVPMMTLAALAANAPDARPSGETQARRETRMLNGISEQLKTLGIGWEMSWGGLSVDGANFAYIAVNASAQAAAVVIRGTIFTPIDLLEDLDVGTLVEFTAVPPAALTEPLLVSKGAMAAFTEVMNIVSAPANGHSTLLDWLQYLVENQNVQTIYVTGHSLGGCIASMVALFLATNPAYFSGTSPHIIAYTFAAPTAGLKAFADCYDICVTKAAPNSSWRIYNAYDAVPNAWASLANLVPDQGGFFPDPGPGENKDTAGLIKAFLNTPNGNLYVQTNQGDTKTSVEINRNYRQRDADAICESVDDFLAQLAYQHQNDTYLKALGEPGLLSPSPIVTGLEQNNTGPVGGGTPVTIRGKNFRRNSVVDFGTVATIDTPTWNSQEELEVTAPPGLGVVDIRVTTDFGTSPVTPADQFAYLPEGTPLAPTITGVGPFPETGLLPNCGPADGQGTMVTITGTGFVSGSFVKFDETHSKRATVVSLTEIIAEAPPSTTPGTVQVTVHTPARQHSKPSTRSAYTYGAPVVTELKPCCGPANVSWSNLLPVIIYGRGFSGGDVSVTFDGKAATVNSVSGDTEISVQPPEIGLSSQETVPVIVMVNGAASGLSAACMFTYTTIF